jgi:hypothetical protein
VWIHVRAGMSSSLVNLDNVVRIGVRQVNTTEGKVGYWVKAWGTGFYEEKSSNPQMPTQIGVWLLAQRDTEEEAQKVVNQILADLHKPDTKFIVVESQEFK